MITGRGWEMNTRLPKVQLLSNSSDHLYNHLKLRL